MPQAIVQTRAGNGTNSSYQTSSTATDHFNSPTTPGNMLVAVVLCVLANNVPVDGPCPDPTINLPTTPGLTWLTAVVSAASPNYLQLGVPDDWNLSKAAIFYCPDAPSIASSVVTSCNTTTSTPTLLNQTQIQLYELSGVTAFEASAWGVDSASAISVPPLSLNSTAIVVALLAALNGLPNENTGAGWTFDYLVSWMETAYKVSVPAGICNVDAWISEDPYPIAPPHANTGAAWAVVAAAFSSAPSTPILQVGPLSLSFYGIQGGSNPPSQNISISNGDGGTLNWIISSDAAWLSATISGSGDATVPVSISLSGLGPGVYTGHLTISAAGATGSPQTILVTLTIVTSASGGGGGDGNTACIPSYTNGLFVPDCSLYIAPATALYSNPIGTTRIKAAESTVEGRKAIVIDFDSGAGLYSRDLEATFTWPVGLPTVLHVFQPSLIEQPEGIYSRAEDWDNGGTTGAKFIQGVIVDANSFNAAKTFQLQSADDLSYHTLNECPATFNGQSEKAFSCTPFVAHSARIISSDGVEWAVFGSQLVFQPFPEMTMNWETEKVSLGLTGWGHAREVNLAYISTAQITLVLSFDYWPSITLTIPSSAGVQLKTKITLPPNKFKLIGFRAYSTAGFRIFASDVEVKVKQWGSPASYVPIKPFGGPSSVGAVV